MPQSVHSLEVASQLAPFSRVLLPDRRGVGLSDRFSAGDVVASTERNRTLGNRAWKELHDQHDAAVRAMVTRYRGTEQDNAGDGFFVTFDGPARAVRCAQAIIETVRRLGLEIRASVHTGEVAATNGKIGGVAVNMVPGSLR